MLATEEPPTIPERGKALGVRIWGSDPMDPTGYTTTSTEFTAWVGGMWRTVPDFCLCEPLKWGLVGVLYTEELVKLSTQCKFGIECTKH